MTLAANEWSHLQEDYLICNSTPSLLPYLVRGVCLLITVLCEYIGLFLGIGETPTFTLTPSKFNFCCPFLPSRRGGDKQHIRVAGVRGLVSPTEGASVLESHMCTG